MCALVGKLPKSTLKWCSLCDTVWFELLRSNDTRWPFYGTILSGVVVLCYSVVLNSSQS